MGGTQFIASASQWGRVPTQRRTTEDTERTEEGVGEWGIVAVSLRLCASALKTPPPPPRVAASIGRPPRPFCKGGAPLPHRKSLRVSLCSFVPFVLKQRGAGPRLASRVPRRKWPRLSSLVSCQNPASDKRICQISFSCKFFDSGQWSVASDQWSVVSGEVEMGGTQFIASASQLGELVAAREGADFNTKNTEDTKANHGRHGKDGRGSGGVEEW